MLAKLGKRRYVRGYPHYIQLVLFCLVYFGTWIMISRDSLEFSYFMKKHLVCRLIFQWLHVYNTWTVCNTKEAYRNKLCNILRRQKRVATSMKRPKNTENRRHIGYFSSLSKSFCERFWDKYHSILIRHIV